MTQIEEIQIVKPNKTNRNKYFDMICTKKTKVLILLNPDDENILFWSQIIILICNLSMMNTEKNDFKLTLK